ncbi:hypothetical protein DYBT9275_05511 [Dyadobacter sp. CECT 9275]|uniref:Nitrate reductase associated protein n=1 Tax=Dyadobacter helix TaxID=2822344 RepID=A0A916JIL0_9BACT|nr:nitrate reductase associated protein [Dyadobacter sp. CECT 9275]CAG5016258.1 hypothetical protein DYBT9275_05511 [Dyadobacter sp. CECT 9275]
MKTAPVLPVFFAFETDFVTTLRCVPMVVRYKLDSCGVKLKLHEWAKFSLSDKEKMAYLPCSTVKETNQYRHFVIHLVWQHFGYEAGSLPSVNDSWNDMDQIPNEVQQKAAEWECPVISLRTWTGLEMLQRFALVKLSRSGHEGRNFPVALREFGIY